MKRFTAVALAGLVVAGVVLAAAVASRGPILATRWWLLWELALWGVLWALAVVLVFRVSPPAGMAVIIVGAIGLRLAALAGPPVTSDDLYRYSWDGRVQAAGIDPYAYPPTSAALVRLRDPWLWPDAAGCAALHRPAGCTRINRPDQRTIYPPLAEAWFAVAYRLGGSGARYKTWQVAGLLTDLGVVVLLITGLGRYGRDRRWVALYALSPAPVLEIVNNGHVDGLGIVLLLGALVVLAGGRAGRRWWPRGRWREVAAGVLIGGAAMVKLYPAVALASVSGVGGPGGVGGVLRSRWSVLRAGIVAALVCALAYRPHVEHVGARVLGYLPGYLREEHYAGGGRFLIAAAVHVPGHVAGVVSVLGVIGVAARVWWRRSSAPVGAAVLLGALLLATSPVQPWYAVSLLAVAALAASPAWVAVVVAGYPYFFAVILASRHAALIGEVAYGGAVLVVLAWSRLCSRAHGGDVEHPTGAPVEMRLGSVACRCPTGAVDDEVDPERPQSGMAVTPGRFIGLPLLKA